MKRLGSTLLICIMATTLFLSGCGLFGEKEPEMLSEQTPESESAEETETSENMNADEEESVEEKEPSANMNIDEEDSVEETVSDGSAQGYFITTDLYGNEVSQKIFTESKLTVVNVWATYCGPCINEMPYLGELADEYDSAQVQIVGIPTDVYTQEYLEYALALVDETGADYTHMLLSEELYNWGLSDIQYVPTTFFVNRDGEIIDTVVGSMSKEDWKELIDNKLASM